MTRTMQPTGIEWAILRDGAWKEARAAYSYEEWERSQHVAGKAPRTILHYAYTLWDLLETHPLKDVDEFTADDCTALLLTYPQRSRGTRAAHLVSYFKHLRKHRKIIENPMELIELPKTPKRRLPDVFSDVEIAALCELPIPDGQLFVLMFECGLRKGECRKLRRRDIKLFMRPAGQPRIVDETSLADLEDSELLQAARLLGIDLPVPSPTLPEVLYGELLVRQSKGDKDRIIPLTQRAAQAVNTLDQLEGLNPDDHLWYARPGGSKQRLVRRFVGDGIGDTTFSNWYSRCLKEAEVPHRKPHMTRHTFAYRWRLSGLAADELQIILGHSSVQTTVDQYGHLSVNDVAKRMREIEGVTA